MAEKDTTTTSRQIVQISVALVNGSPVSCQAEVVNGHVNTFHSSNTHPLLNYTAQSIITACEYVIAEVKKLNPMIVLFFAITILSGCTNIQAIGPQPFPAITEPGQTITLAPGTYTCPANIPPGTHIIGQGSIVPAEMLASNWSPKADTSALPEARIQCSNSLKITGNGVEISGVVLDFQGLGGGLILENTYGGKLDLGIVNSDTALTLHASTAGTGVVDLTVPRLEIFNTNTAIYMRGDGGGAITWNTFGHVSIAHAAQHAIVFSQFADTNVFDVVSINMTADETGDAVIFNENSVTAYDVDAGGNRINWLTCDGVQSPNYCVTFRGYEVGNNVTVGYGIMPDANKVHFDNDFDQSANRVVKMQEFPKAP